MGHFYVPLKTQELANLWCSSVPHGTICAQNYERRYTGARWRTIAACLGFRVQKIEEIDYDAN